MNINQNLDDDDRFGYSVSLDDNLLAVGARDDSGSDHTPYASGAVYLYSFSDSALTGGSLQAIIGDGYTGGEYVNQNLDTNDGFGYSLSDPPGEPHAGYG